MLLAAALAATVWRGAHGRFGDGGYSTVQVVGMVAFGAVALVAVAVDPTASRYLVAAGWLAHGVWDFVHLWRDRVVGPVLRRVGAGRRRAGRRTPRRPPSAVVTEAF